MRGIVAAACIVLISCGGPGGASSTGGTGGGGGGGTGGNGIVTLRVANLTRVSGSTGPSLDIYDDMYDGSIQPSVSGIPIIANLAYGAVSGYVNPRFVDGGGTSIQLVALRAGSPPTDTTHAEPFWVGIDNGSHPQLTIGLNTEFPSSRAPGSSIGYDTYVEKGQDSFSGDLGPLAPPPPAGEGEYLINTFEVDDTLNAVPPGGYFFLVDDACTPQLNGYHADPGLPLVETAGGLPPEAYAQFPEAPGAHSISIVAWNSTTPPPACSDLPSSKQGTTSATLAAGQQILTILYGLSFTDLHLLAAPIAP